MTNPIKNLFLLNPKIHFLNHGSYGACPTSVIETYQAWQIEMERQPVEFLGRRAVTLMAEARGRLAAYLGVEADEIVYFSNPTTAINMVIRNLGRRIDCSKRRNHRGITLQPGDEILATDHEYGAMDRSWRYICRQVGARYINLSIPLPINNPDVFTETFWARVNERTKIIFISHITSPTALTFPIEEICRRARQHNILTIIDGAHVPGHLALDLKVINADIYTGACHKWLCAPKGSAFLYVRRELQDQLDPLIISWGYESDQPGDSQFVDYHEWQGTRDLSAILSVPAAIDFQAQNDWETVRSRCHTLAVHTRKRINDLTGFEPLCPDDWFEQMFTAYLPQETDLTRLKQRLYDDFHIEVPTILWNGKKMIRVSIQGYNDQDDVDALLEALTKLL
jgi:isopenicillin-N epimerase